MKKIITLTSAIILLVSIVIGTVGCGASAGAAGSTSNTASADTKLAKIKKAGKLVVGTSADYPPYEFHKVTNGKDEIVGFDITVAKEIAKDLGVQLELKDMKFDGLLAALDAGNIDMVIAGMVPTDERKKSVDFSKIYYQSVNNVLVRSEDKDKLKSIEDLKGKKVGAQKSTVQEDIVKKQMPNSEPKLLSKVTDLVLELKNKKVDALVIDKPVADAYAAKNSDLAVGDIKLENADKGCAVAVKKGSQDFVDAINKTLDRLMSTDSINKFVTDANNMVE
jgi:arginine/lysine/histidine transporter system substrate-binding protein